MVPGLLQGRTALITGAARERGIGRATARLFAQHGARVVLLDLGQEDPAAAARSIGPDHMGLACDVRDAGDCRDAAARAMQWSGRIDILVNNAAVTQRRGVMEVTAEDYELVTGVALRGTLQMSQAVIPQMIEQGGGSVICISSLSAQQGGGVFGGGHYCAAKAGVLGLTRAMAKELGPRGVRVNAVTPGLILTDFSRGQNTDDNKHELAKSFPLGRVGRPDDIAGACLYLASDLSSFVTGATIDVNGGFYMR